MEDALMPAVQAETILREMAAQWAAVAAAGASDSPETAGVVRACSMTLIVAAESEADAARAGETVAALMQSHPSRAIVLKPAPRQAALDARVILQCWLTSGARRQICCERIEITIPEGNQDEVLRVIPGLLAPDLPAVLWCRGDVWTRQQPFARLHELLDRIIVDSSCTADPAEALCALAALRQGRTRVSDLAWTRLTLWRETIANTVAASGVEDPDAVQEVEVRHAGARPSTAALYLAAWLLRVFRNAAPVFRSVPGDGQVAGVAIQAGRIRLELDRLAGQTVRVSGCAGVQALHLPHASEERSMREELAIAGPDGVFEETLAPATELAAKWHA
ncbi:MAG: glucose-6-phosphate dehydrogenase assembly protein OpcA [Bryobacteraceae bacterium]